MFLLLQLFNILPILFDISLYMSIWLELLPWVKDMEKHINEHNYIGDVIDCLVGFYFMSFAFLALVLLKRIYWNDLGVKIASLVVFIFFLGFLTSGLLNGMEAHVVFFLTAPGVTAGIVLMVKCWFPIFEGMVTSFYFRGRIYLKISFGNLGNQ